VHLDVGELRDADDAVRVANSARAVAVPAVLVNATGTFGPIGRPSETSPDDFQLTFGVNVVAPVALAQLLARDLLAAGRGRIVNVSSAQSLHPPDPVVAAYATTKVALNFATRCLAAELDGSDVSACVIHPGDLLTSMWADIARRAEDAGPVAAGLRQWAARVRATGGDSPDSGAALVSRIVERDAAWSNGRFLTIDGGFDHHPAVGW
jgi:NAD(P)-dependent dehydrogenase (short-subunit alcohol dehydrogenase family)